MATDSVDSDRSRERERGYSSECALSMFRLTLWLEYCVPIFQLMFIVFILLKLGYLIETSPS